MPTKPKRTNVKTPHKDFAAKNSMNPSRGGPNREGQPMGGTEEQDVKRRVGQFSGAGTPPVIKK
jgi:hypothetical protein